MIGHKQIIELRKKRRKPVTVFMSFGKPFNADNDIKDQILPTVYVRKSTPELADLSWAKGLDIQLLPCDDLQLYTRWWCALVDAGVKGIVGIDSDGEINVYSGR
jgi:hypothetical protein